ncbi:MAG: hypothetical protein ACI8PZ_003735, partial [Myxococcota bacterium]
RRIAIVKVGGVTGLLPPPIGLLYTPDATPIARLPGGGQVLLLRNGPMMLYAAVAIRDGNEILAIAFTPGAAIGALEHIE